MKTFWYRALLKFLLYFGLVLLVMFGMAYVKGSFVLSGFVVAAVVIGVVMLLRSAIGIYLELWMMKRMATKFEVDLDLFAQVRYENELDLMLIRTNEDFFRVQLEKKKLFKNKEGKEKNGNNIA